MKTAISVPDDIFRQADRYARKSGKSRSELYSEAVRQYLLRHTSEAVTDAMNSACEEIGEQDNAFAGRASRRMLRHESW